MDDQFKLSGWAMTLYGVATLSAFFYVLFLSFTQVSLFETFSLFIIVISLIVFLFNALPLFSGFHLLKHNQTIHKLALPTSVIIMFAFPVGTFVGGLYLWQRYKIPNKQINQDK